MDSNFYEKLIRLEQDGYLMTYKFIIYNTSRRESINKLKMLLVRHANNLNLSSSEMEKCWYCLKKQYNYAINLSNFYIRGKKSRSEAAFLAVKYYYTTKPLVRQVFYSLSLSHEAASKQDYIQDKLKSCVESRSPFVICSKHRHCRPSHTQFQGKILIDARYKQYLDEETARVVEQYANKRRLITIQDAISEPYYLITAPNCHHFLTIVSIDDVLSFSTRSLLRKNSMYVNNQNSNAINFKKIDKIFYQSMQKIASNGLLEAFLRR